MPNVVRFALSTARTLEVPGAGTFRDGVLDVPADDLIRVGRVRFLVQPYRATEIGIVDSATPLPDLPAVPVPPAADPYPQYLDPSELLDGETGRLLDGKLPARLSEVELRAALVSRNPVIASTVYDDDGNLTSWTEAGVAHAATYDPVTGNIATLTVAGVTRTFTFDADDNLVGAA